MSKKEEQLHVNILMHGDDGVGINQLVNRFMKDTYSDLYSHGRPNGEIITKENINTQFRIHGIPNNTDEGVYSSEMRKRHQDVHMVVFDVTNQTSFNNIEWYVNKIKEHKEDAKIILVGNKADLDSQRFIENQDAVRSAEELGVEYIECSAKTGQNVDALFQAAARLQHGKRIDRGLREAAQKQKRKTGVMEEVPTLRDLHDNVQERIQTKPELSGLMRTLTTLARHAQREMDKSEKISAAGKASYREKYNKVEQLFQNLQNIVQLGGDTIEMVDDLKNEIDDQLKDHDFIINRSGSKRYETASKLLSKFGGHFKYHDKDGNHFAHSTTEHLLIKLKDQVNKIEQDLPSRQSIDL